MEAATNAFGQWSQKTASKWQQLLIKFADLLERDADEIAELESITIGVPKSKYKPIVEGCAEGIRTSTGPIS